MPGHRPKAAAPGKPEEPRAEEPRAEEPRASAAPANVRPWTGPLRQGPPTVTQPSHRVSATDLPTASR